MIANIQNTLTTEQIKALRQPFITAIDNLPIVFSDDFKKEAKEIIYAKTIPTTLEFPTIGSYFKLAGIDNPELRQFGMIVDINGDTATLNFAVEPTGEYLIQQLPLNGIESYNMEGAPAHKLEIPKDLDFLTEKINENIERMRGEITEQKKTLKQGGRKTRRRNISKQ